MIWVYDVLGDFGLLITASFQGNKKPDNWKSETEKSNANFGVVETVRKI